MRIGMLAAALAVSAAAPGPGRAQSGQARCPAAHGHAARTCAKARKPPVIARCRDVISHRFARCGGPNAEPVPAN